MTMIEQQLLFVVANQVVKLHSRPKPSMIIAVSSRTLFYSVHRQQLQYGGGDKPAVHNLPQGAPFRDTGHSHGETGCMHEQGPGPMPRYASELTSCPGSFVHCKHDTGSSKAKS